MIYLQISNDSLLMSYYWWVIWTTTNLQVGSIIIHDSKAMYSGHIRSELFLFQIPFSWIYFR